MKETKCQESSKPLGQVEDEIMKTGAQFFGEELLKWLGVKEPVKGIASYGAGTSGNQKDVSGF